MKELEYNTGFWNYETARIDANTNCFAVQHPFNNCQNFAVGSFNVLLKSTSEQSIKETTNFLVTLRKKWGKNYCILDLNDNTYERLKGAIKEGLFNASFVVEAPYENANGSDMVLCIIDVSQLEFIE